MKHSYTQEELTEYLYNETGVYDSIELEEAMDENSALQESFQQIVDGFEQLQPVELQPPPSVIQRILNYSEETSLEAELF